MQVCSLVSSAERHSPDFAKLPPGNRTCSFISHRNSPGRIQPGCHFRRTELFRHRSHHCPTTYPLTPGSRECTFRQSAMRRTTTSEHFQRSRGSNPRSLACMSRTLPLSHDASLFLKFAICTLSSSRHFFSACDPLCDYCPDILIQSLAYLLWVVSHQSVSSSSLMWR